MLNPQILSFLQQYLAEFAATEDFESTIESIFGTDIDRVQLVKIRQQWLAGAMSVIPPIEIRRRAEINGANGAFSLATGKIYLAQELLENRALEEVVPVLLEEYGHFVDAQLNTVDASGDEGAIFSALVRGKVLDGYQLSALRSEDDTATVLLDGKLVQIEQDIDGDAGNNNLVGTDGDDTINAGVGIDTVNGGAGNDLLIVDYSSNTYTGTNPGAGLRTSSILPNSDPLSFDGVYSANRAGSFDLLTFSNIERFQITGTIADDMIATGAGNDTINGGVGNDTIDGGAGNDILNGGAGNDTIDNNRGIDTIDGGEGIDTLVNSDFSSSTESLAFVDTGVTHTPINLIDGSSVSNTEHFINLITGSGNDTINFTQTQTINNNISTGSGDDTINAGVGIDTVNGGAGNDLLIVDYSSNTYTGTNPAAGFRTPSISPNSDPLSFDGIYNATRAGSFDQLFFSNIERFQITGTIVDDRITTGAGNDIINGGAGNDTINGGGGDDTINGGSGDDIYILNAINASGSSIQDSAGTDSLSLLNAQIVLSEAQSGRMGLGRLNTSLIVDLNQDGVINPGTDLSILDFYNDSFSNTAGIGFLENIGNISGGGVLGLTLLDLNINVNEAPTAVTLTNSVTSLAENTNTAARLKVADIGITDDALGTNNLSLSGADAGIFEIFDNDLYVRAGTVFNFATKSSYAVAVAVDDLTVGNTPDATTNFTLGITDVNEAPTAVTLTNSVTSLAENTNTTTRLKVADISITDDALGTNSLSLSGADADIFEIFDNDLYVKAGTVLDFETKSSYAVTVAVDDLTVGNTPDATTNFTLGITDVNEAPTAVTLTNSVTSLAENTNTAARLKVADISITDDVLGTNNLSLSGADADIFEIFDNDLYVRAGTVLDFETKSSYAVTVAVDDLAVGNTPDATTNFTLGITDVFEDFSLSTLNGTNGFAINGINADDNSGYSVSSVGDINGDGIDDLIIGARYADPNGNFSGQSYVVFGSRSGFSASLNLSTLIGTNGFAINGINAYDNSGRSVSSAGDINGDGIDDLIIGALFADPNGNIFSGQSYVVFGSRSPFSSSINLSTITGTNGFRLNGVAAGDRSGISVSSAGDINGDGIDDLIIGAYRADLNRISDVGQSYVVFGRRSTNSINLSTLTGADGFRINGIAVNDRSGTSVSSAGDINGDGIDDLIIGAPNADPNGSYSGQSYVVFGSRTPFSANLNLSTINGANGFAINGINLGDRSGTSVSSAGDINGDGIDDLIIGARDADSNGNFSGQSYVVFGSRSPFSANLNLSTLTGANGFAINGINADDDSGISVSSAGDINGDGIDDLIIGAPNADPNGISNSGQSYVVFGSRSPFSANLNLSTLIGTKGFTINGINADDRLGISVSSAGDINNDGIDDLIIGADRADPNGSASGQSYVVYGNAAPELDLDLNGSTGFTINGIDFNTTFIGAPIAVVDTDLTLVDRNSPNLTGATITITNPLNGAAETLNVTTTGSITSSYSNGVLTLSGSGTVAQYQQVLRTVTYNNTTATPISTPRTITFVVNDGAASSNASMIATTTLSFNNAAPINTVPTAQTVNEDTQLAITGISVIDVDGNLATTQLNVTNGALNVTLNGATISSGANNSNTLTLSGTQTQINNTLATLKYQGNLNFNGSDTLTVLSIDSTGTPLSDSDTVEIIVNSVNNAPVNSFPTAQTVNEDTQLAITGISVIDVDGNLATTQLNVTNGTLNVTLNGATISSGANNSNTITLSGTQTQINNTLATLKYQGNPNFNGSDTLTVLSTDSTGTPLSDSDTVGITVNFVNTAPELDLNGTNNLVPGFAINGVAAGDLSGTSVSSAGDINGDGIDDLIIGADLADSNGTDSGQSYVVFGSRSGFSSSLNLSTLTGTNGFRINGVAAGDNSGTSVSSAGDINGDGLDDLIIGALFADPNGISSSGQSYIVFGSRSGFSSSLNLSTLDGDNGFQINGINLGDRSGASVSSAGDINGDGIDDLIIGALFADPNGISRSGQSYVVFGSRSGFSSSLNLSTLIGTNGFAINGISAGVLSGRSVSSAGDINGDGIDDLIIGATGANPNGNISSGQSYVVFGSRSGFSSSLNLSTLTGTNGFGINGVAAGDNSGRSVSSAGDINGDGLDDLIIGADLADPNGISSSGQSYVVFGSRSPFSSNLNLSTLTGADGFHINGIALNDRSGTSVSSAGDINGDGLDDLIIGAAFANPNGISSSGQSYVVFGSRSPFSSNLNLSTLNGTNGFAVNGINAADISGLSVSGAGDINGDGIDDLIIGAAFADPNGNFSGQSYVVFGRAGIGASGTLELSQLSDGIDFNTTFIGTPIAVVDTDLTLVDRNSPNLTGATITITNPLNGAAETLSATTTGSITSSYGNGVLTLSGSGTVAQYQQVLRTVTYNNTATALISTPRIITFLVNDGAASSNTSTIATTTLLIGATIDRQISAANDITLDLIATTDSGTSDTDNITRFQTPIFAVTFDTTKAQFGDILEIRNGATVLGTTTLTATQVSAGTANVTLTTALTGGLNTLSAVHRDLAGNSSTGINTLGVTFDQQISAANAVTLDLRAASDSGVSQRDNITNVATPTIALTFDNTKAQAGDILEVRRGSIFLAVTVINTAQVNAGRANVTLTTSLANGLNTLSAVHRDRAGNSSFGTNTLGITFDQRISATNVVTLDLLATSDSGVSQIDNITNVARPTFALTFDNTRAQAGDILEVRRGNVVLGTRTLTAAQVSAGTVNLTLATALTNVSNNLSAVHRDLAGNTVTSATLAVTRDNTEPLVPVILGYSSTSVTGTAPANTTLLFSTSSSLPRSFAATTAISSNNYTINTSSLVGSSAGQAYYLYAQDVAGNLSVASPQRVVVGAATGGTLSNVGGTGSDLLVGNNETLHTVEYAVSGNNISLTGQINASNVTSQSVNIKNANIDVFTSIEQLNFIGSGYGAITANTPGLNQLRGQVQNNPAVLLNNSISAFTGAYDASLGTFSIGSANSNATLVAFDSNSGFNQNYEAFLLLDKTSISGSIGFNRGVVSLTL